MQLEHDHSSEAIRQRLLADNTPNYLRDWVYGGIDGSITTFAIVAGVVGAGLSTKVILILGMSPTCWQTGCRWRRATIPAPRPKWTSWPASAR
jgi:hypothetical protein